MLQNKKNLSDGIDFCINIVHNKNTRLLLNIQFYVFSLIVFNQIMISDVFTFLVIMHVTGIPFENESNIIRIKK